MPSVVAVSVHAEIGGWNACEISVAVLVTRRVSEGRWSSHERCWNPSLTRRVTLGKVLRLSRMRFGSGVNLTGVAGERLAQRAAVASLFGGVGRESQLVRIHSLDGIDPDGEWFGGDFRGCP